MIPTISMLAMISFVARGVVILNSESSVLADSRQSSIPTQPIEEENENRVEGVSEADIETILERNIFDSVTGSVLYSDLPAEKREPTETGKLDITDLIRCPGSEDIKVEATVSDEGNVGDSFASINQSGSSTQLFIGDELLNRKVVAVTWRYIILQGTGDVCYLDMF